MSGPGQNFGNSAAAAPGTRQNRGTVLGSCCCSEKFCRETEVKRECGTEREDNSSSSSALLLLCLLLFRLLFFFLPFLLLFHTFSARFYPLLRLLKIQKKSEFYCLKLFKKKRTIIRLVCDVSSRFHFVVKNIFISLKQPNPAR